MADPHDIPTAVQLVEAVREFIEGDVMDATEGRVKFHARVARNVLAMVERELALGTEQRRDHEEGLAALGIGSAAELAEGIRSGAFDDRLGEVAAFVRSSVEAKLKVANPGYLDNP